MAPPTVVLWVLPPFSARATSQGPFQSLSPSFTTLSPRFLNNRAFQLRYHHTALEIPVFDVILYRLLIGFFLVFGDFLGAFVDPPTDAVAFLQYELLPNSKLSNPTGYSD